MHIYKDKLDSFFEPISDVMEFNRIKRKKYLSLTTNEFIERAISIHGEKYDYSKTQYVNTSTNVLIICNKHKIEFTQTLTNHLYGPIGCSICNKNIKPKVIRKKNVEVIHRKKDKICSTGERLIEFWLNKNLIKYEKQKTFDGCKNRRKLRYDFYLPNQNMLIEYDGRQHFNSIECFGGENELILTQLHDKIKTEFAINNGFNLLRISYNERNNLSNILKNNMINN